MRPIVLGKKQIPILFEAGFFLVDFVAEDGFASQALQALGFAARELRDGTYQGHIHPDDLPRYTELWERFHRGESDELFCEYRVRGADGAWHWIQTTAVMVERGPDGALAQVLGHDRDVTSQWETDHKLRMEVSDLERDALTGFLTRRAFERDAAILWQRSSSVAGTGGIACQSVAIIDIDEFKQVNDRYGHATGDTLIQRIAAEIRGQVRGTDLLGRFGGDEFVIILPDADCEVASEIVDRVRSAVAAIVMEGLNHSPSISIGLASVIPPTPLPDALKAADEALYRAKRAGRNRVEPVQR